MRKNELMALADNVISDGLSEITPDVYDPVLAREISILDGFENSNHESVIEHIIIEDNISTHDILDLGDYQFDDNIESISEWLKEN